MNIIKLHFKMALQELFIRAIKKGKVKRVKFLVFLGVDVNDEENPSLLLAMLNNHRGDNLGVISALVESGAGLYDSKLNEKLERWEENNMFPDTVKHIRELQRNQQKKRAPNHLRHLLPAIK